MSLQTNPEERLKAKTEAKGDQCDAPVRRRLGVAERERQIVDGAIRFFSEHGFAGQLRDLAQSIGVTHALLYHYFPTKQALIDRVYVDVFEGRWRSQWDALLDDPHLSVEDKFTTFYGEYVNITLSKEFTRILVFSGLSDHTITDRFFAMLRTRLFPRLVRETRRFRGVVSRAKPSERELELLMSIHGSFFYISMRRWIYGQNVYGDSVDQVFGEPLVRDRVMTYLQASRVLLKAPVKSQIKRSSKE